MASPGVWGVIPQSEGVAQAAVEKVQSQLSSNQVSGDSTSDSINGLEKDDPSQAVTELARQITQHSIKNGDGSYPNPFAGSDDPALDPRSSGFKPEVWTKTIMGSGMVDSSL